MNNRWITVIAKNNWQWNLISTLTSPYSSDGWLEKTTTSSCVAVLRCQTAGIGYSQVARAIRCLIGFVVGGCWVIPLRFLKVPQDLGILTVPYRTTPGTLEHPGTLKKSYKLFLQSKSGSFLFFFCDGLASLFPCGSWRCVSFRKKMMKPNQLPGRFPTLFWGKESTPRCIIMWENSSKNIFSQIWWI